MQNSKKMVAGALLTSVVALSACGLPTEHTYGTKTPGASSPPSYTRPPAPATPVSTNTPGQDRAIDKALSYLDYTAFSAEGLVKQLTFEGFPAADAQFAVQQINVDWNEQAAKKAESYLEYTSFSLDGLVTQLKFEGFTDAQAQYGAQAAY